MLFGLFICIFVTVVFIFFTIISIVEKYKTKTKDLTSKISELRLETIKQNNIINSLNKDNKEIIDNKTKIEKAKKRAELEIEMLEKELEFFKKKDEWLTELTEIQKDEIFDLKEKIEKKTQIILDIKEILN